MMDTNIQPDDLIEVKLDACGFIDLPVAGISMGNRWAEAGQLHVESRRRRNPRWGDVVLYRIGNGMVAHRIIGTCVRHDSRWWITKGDGYWTPDRIPVADRDVLGVVVSYSIQERVVRVDKGARKFAGFMHALSGCLGRVVWPPIWPA